MPDNYTSLEKVMEVNILLRRDNVVGFQGDLNPRKQ